MDIACNQCKSFIITFEGVTNYFLQMWINVREGINHISSRLKRLFNTIQGANDLFIYYGLPYKRTGECSLRLCNRMQERITYSLRGLGAIDGLVSSAIIIMKITNISEPVNFAGIIHIF